MSSVVRVCAAAGPTSSATPAAAESHSDFRMATSLFVSTEYRSLAACQDVSNPRTRRLPQQVRVKQHGRHLAGHASIKDRVSAYFSAFSVLKCERSGGRWPFLAGRSLPSDERM